MLWLLYPFVSFCYADTLERCQYDDKTYDRNCLQEINYFSKFVELDFPRQETFLEGNRDNKNPTWDMSLLYTLRDNILPQIYTSAENTNQTLKILSQIFLDCSKNGKTESIKRICEYISSYVVGKEVKQSNISLQNIISTLKNNKIGISRTTERSDFDENFVPLNYGHGGITIASGNELWIGDMLFGVSDAYYIDTPAELTFTPKKWNGILVLKAWDTHWQEMVRLTFQNPKNLYTDKRIAFINHKLYYAIPTLTDQKDQYLTAQYEFQKNGSRKLKACFDEKTLCPKNEDCTLKQKKIPLKKCENLGITIKTVL